jgi:hypothetical protein
MSPAPSRGPSLASPEEWSLAYVRRLYAESDTLLVEEFEDLIAWVLDGGDLRLLTARPPWPWRGR